MKAAKIVLLAFLFSIVSYSQNDDHHNSHGLQGSHRLTFGVGHSHLSEGKIDGKTEWLAVPSFNLNYDYWFSNQWAIGLQNDLILESFIIEHGDEELLERSYPLAVIPVGIFKPGKHWSFIGGVGAEIAHEKTLTVTRLGVEYGWHLPGNWEVGGAIVWDNKWNYYNSWGLSLAISKIWKKH